MQLRTADGAQVGPAGQDDRVHVVVRGDRADGDGGDPGGVADQVGVRGLVAAAVAGQLVGDDLAGGDVDGVGAGLGERAGDGDRVGLAGAALGPVGGGDPHEQGLARRPHRTHGP